MGIVYLNDQFLPENEAKIPVSDRGFLFGEGVFSTIRVRNGKAEFLDRHLMRLANDSDTLGMTMPLFQTDWVDQLIEKNSAQTGVWRLKIIITSAGVLLMTLHKEELTPPTSCRLTLYPRPLSYPTSVIKSLAYIDRLWIKQYARQQKFYDAVTMHLDGCMLETAFCNIFWLHDKRLVLPNPVLPYLPGVALSVVKDIHQNQRVDVAYHKWEPDQIPMDASMFICNAMIGIVPVEEFAGRNFVHDDGVTQALQNAFDEYSA